MARYAQRETNALSGTPFPPTWRCAPGAVRNNNQLFWLPKTRRFLSRCPPRTAEATSSRSTGGKRNTHLGNKNIRFPLSRPCNCWRALKAKWSGQPVMRRVLRSPKLATAVSKDQRVPCAQRIYALVRAFLVPSSVIHLTTTPSDRNDPRKHPLILRGVLQFALCSFVFASHAGRKTVGRNAAFDPSQPAV